MRRTGKAAVVAAVVLGALGFGGAGVAQAAELPLLDVVIELDRTAPSTGELVRGVRAIGGYAEAPEGISRVDLYVVRHSLTNRPTDSAPVASFRPSVPLGRATFEFEWDSATTPAGLVDVAVVATSTTTRTAEARILSVRVEHVVEQAAPVAPKPKAKAKSAATAAKPASTSRATANAAAAASAQRAAFAERFAALPKVQVAQAKQAEAFYSAFAAAETALEAEAAPAPAGVMAPLAKATRGAWPSVAVGLILLVAAGHVQRAVRVSLA